MYSNAGVLTNYYGSAKAGARVSILGLANGRQCFVTVSLRICTDAPGSGVIRPLMNRESGTSYFKQR